MKLLRRPPSVISVILVTLLLVTCGALAKQTWRQWQHDRLLSERLPDWRLVAGLPACQSAKQEANLNLLILGQSNAANHGEMAASAAPGGVGVIHPDGCVLAGDPLPGGTGHGASIWSRLPDVLRAAGVPRDLSLAILAVESTSIDDWTRDSSPLKRQLSQRLAQLSAQKWRPDLILWQQGETDALQGTSREDYVRGFEGLRRLLRNQGVDAPILLAKSTSCDAAEGAEVRAAMDQLHALHPDLRPGPDTDTLQDQHRAGPCHLSARGLTQAATLWAQAIKSGLKAPIPLFASSAPLAPDTRAIPSSR